MGMQPMQQQCVCPSTMMTQNSHQTGVNPAMSATPAHQHASGTGVSAGMPNTGNGSGNGLSSIMSSNTMMLLATLNSMMATVSMMVSQTMMMLMQGQTQGQPQTGQNGTGSGIGSGTDDIGTYSGGGTEGSGTSGTPGTSGESNTPIDSSGFSQDWSAELKHIPQSDRQAFLQRVLEIAQKMEMDPDHLMAVFMSESQMNPAAVNPTSNATGLIQFMPDTAKSLGTSIGTLKNMSALDQLDYVEKFLTPYKGKMNTKSDAYMAVFSPAYVGRGDNHVAYRTGQKAYTQNSGLDANKDGQITNGELAIRLDKYLA